MKNDPEITLEKYRLSSNKLKTIGVQVTRLRLQIRKEVERDQIHQAVEQETSLEEVQKIAGRSKRRYTIKELIEKQQQRPDLDEKIPPGSRHRSRKHQPMSIDEKIKIVYQSLVEKHMHNHIAREHRISIGTVSRLVCKAKRKKEFYSELLARQSDVADKHSRIKEAIESMVSQHVFLDSVESIHDTIQTQHQLKVKKKEVHHVLKHDLEMSFKKIIPISIHGNSAKNLVL